MRRQQWIRAIALGASLSLVAAACGDDSDDGGNGDGGDGGDEEATSELDCPDAGVEASPGEPEPTDGFDGETINVGALTPTSGTVALIGEPLTAGNQAYFDWLNEEEGGIAGQYPVEVEVVDSEYNATTAGNEYQNMSQNIAMFVQILGTPVVDALLADLELDCIVAGPASLDSKWVHEPTLMPIGAPYQMQAINGIDWYYAEEGSEDDVLCALASDDEYGDAGLEGVDYIAGELGLTVEATPRFPAPAEGRPEQTFDAQVSELESAGCDVVFFIAVATDTTAFADKLAETDGFDPAVLAQSPTWLGLFAENEYMQEHFYIINEGSQWGDEGTEFLADLLENHGPEDLTPDIYFNFGVFQAMAATQILEKAVELGDLSREGILNAMGEVGTLTFDGMYGDYPYGPPEDREPPVVNTINRINPELAGENGTGLETIVTEYQADSVEGFEF